MEEFVAYIIKNLVSHPEEVSVSSSLDQEKVRIEIRVAKEDVGKVIGRRGNTINALRTIVRTVATRLGQKAQVELIQSDDEALDNEALVVQESFQEEECCVDDPIEGEPALV
ncbi:MAG: KH domain-containing protein [Chlamydiales bacterium]|nr:KH domain-containing protein [Chlamydiales bacterium]